MIDTHAHLTARFEQEADLAGLDYVILAASNLEDSEENLKLAKNNKKLLAAIGIHPQELGDNIDDLEKLMSEEVTAIGECGLEFEEGVNKNKQINLFRRQIELSLKYKKPIIVHSRKASDETLEILKDYKNLRGVIHCYTGGKKGIKKYLEISPDWYFGVDGNLTYELGLEEVVKNIPKGRLLAETDTPYLSPIPYRGETNRPEYVRYVYQKIGQIWGENAESQLDDNARKLFQII